MKHFPSSRGRWPGAAKSPPRFLAMASVVTSVGGCVRTLSASRSYAGARLVKRSTCHPRFGHRAKVPEAGTGVVPTRGGHSIGDIPGARSLSASEDTAGRTGPSGLGTLWKAHHRQGRTHLDGLRDGAEFLAGDLSALLPRCADGQLPAWPPGRLHGLGWTAPSLALRQPEKCRARAPGRCHPLPSHAAGIRRPLSLRTAPGGGGAGQ